MFRSWRLFAFIGVLVLILLGPLLYSVFRTKGDKLLLQPMKLEWWRMADAPEDLNAIIGSYQALHPNVSVNVKVLRPAEYELALLNAWARDAGPDIVSLPVGDWRARINNLFPAPATVQVPYVTYEGFRNDQVVHKNTTKLPTINDLGGLFADTVKADVVANGKIYGLPLALDTIVTYYNRDLLNRANIAEPAGDWTEFKDQVAALALVDKSGRFIQYGTALGEANNLPLAFELLSALMMQSGTVMTNDVGTRATFDQPISSSGQDFLPGEDALRFFTDFSNPTKEVYTWSEDELKSLDAFISGRLAYYFGYLADAKVIRRQAPRLNFAITTFPQIAGSVQPVYYADYNIEAVAAKSKHPNEAWELVYFAATKPEENKKYLASAGKTTALRAVIAEQMEDFDLASAASQVLSSRTWYRGYDSAAARQALLAMIRAANSGASLTEALTLAAKQVTQTLAPR